MSGCGINICFPGMRAAICGKDDVLCQSCQITILRTRAERAEAERDDEKKQRQLYMDSLLERHAELQAAQSTIADLTGQVERMRKALAYIATFECGDSPEAAARNARAALGGAE